MTDLKFLPGQRFDCTQCGRCCRGWRVLVDKASGERVAGTPLEQRLERELGHPPMRRDTDGRLRTALTEAGDCSFLDARQLCSIHREMGRNAKPRVCRQFPFLIRPTPDGIVIGASFYCPSIQANSGRLLESHTADIQELIAEGDYAMVGDRPIEVARGKVLEWSGYRALEACLSERLASMDADQALARPLWKIGQWVISGDRPSDVGQQLPDTPDEGDMRRILDDSEGTPPFDAGAGAMWVHVFSSSLIGVLEARVVEEAWPVTEALMEGRDVTLPGSGWSGPTTGLMAFVDERVGNRFDAEIARYLEALLFRKFLAVDRPLLENLLLMSLLPRLLRFYTGLACLVRTAGEPEPGDFHHALDTLEQHVITHVGATARFPSFSESYLGQIEARLAG